MKMAKRSIGKNNRELFRAEESKSIRFLIIGDLHGQMPRIYFKDFDAIIAPGDICSDKGIRDVFMKMYRNYVKDVSNYQDWWDITGKKRAKKMTYNSLDAGRRILKFLKTYKKPIFIVPGNWDWAIQGKEDWEFMNHNFWKERVIKGMKDIHDVDGKIKRFYNIQIIGYGTCNGPELVRYRGYGGISKARLKRNESRYKKSLKKYNKLFSRLKKDLPVIYLSHNVPFKTRLDTIVDNKNPLNGKHFGSNLARAMIEKHRPLVNIGGHMHEHFGKDKIGRTTIINAGFGSHVNTLLEIKDGKIIKLKFYRGHTRSRYP